VETNASPRLCSRTPNSAGLPYASSRTTCFASRRARGGCAASRPQRSPSDSASSAPHRHLPTSTAACVCVGRRHRGTVAGSVARARARCKMPLEIWRTRWGPTCTCPSGLQSTRRIAAGYILHDDRPLRTSATREDTTSCAKAQLLGVYDDSPTKYMSQHGRRKAATAYA
jgi:hypothetical protein